MAVKHIDASIVQARLCYLHGPAHARLFKRRDNRGVGAFVRARKMEKLGICESRVIRCLAAADRRRSRKCL
jgi:hypothetical protein